MKHIMLLFFLLVPIISPAEPIDYTSFVNPFIGTTRDGTTFPGAVAPFGMLQWSPDTGDRIGGYLYEDTAIRGFSLYRVSGTGGLHGQDLPFMPTFGPLNVSPVHNKKAYESRFSHEREHASPGQYQVHLDDTDIDVDLAVTTRSGIGSFRFPAGQDAAMILHPTGRIGEVYESRFTIDPAQRKISGYSFGAGAGNGYALYVVAEFDQAFSSFGFWRGEQRLDGLREAVGKDIAAWLRFDTTNQQRVQMRVGVSYVSLANAEENLKAEISHWDQTALKNQTRAAWNAILERIAVKGGTPDERTMFYTALYHASLHPNIWNDVNGQYMGMDDKVHTIEPGHNKYVNYSLWDVYRTIPQLQALLQPAIASDMVRSLLLDSQQCEGGGLPIFGVLNSAPGIMCGYPADPFMASAYAFGARDFDAVAVQRKMVETAMNQMPCGPNGGAWWHLDDYKKGYVAHESTEWGSISYNIEYAVADFATAMMSAAVGDEAQYDYFLKRSQNWRNLFNPAVGFMQERYRNGSWVPHFSRESTEGYMEGNAVQQTLMVPHNIAGVMNQTQLHHPIEPQLDQFFSQILTSGWPTDQPYYWAGNEPMIGMPWYYNWLQKPWKTQEIVSRVRAQAFTNTPGGLPGNDDLGTMSAWYVFAALGLYPEIPGVAGFSLNAPLFPEARLTLGDGRILDIQTNVPDTRNLYVQSVQVNSTHHSSTWLPLSKLLASGHASLVYNLGASPSAWGTAPEDIPPSFDENGEKAQRVHGMSAQGVGAPATVIDRDIQTTAATDRLFYTFPSARGINEYTVTAGWDTARLRSWQLQGSNDGQQWMTLDSRTEESFKAQETRSFAFTSCESFSHFRLELNGVSEVAEWALYERPRSREVYVAASAHASVSSDGSKTIPVTLPRSGRYALRVRYAVDTRDAALQILVNGQDAGAYTWPRAYSHREGDAGTHDFKAGENVVTLLGSFQGLSVESLILIAQDQADPLYVEAEWGALLGAQVKAEHTGSWGSGYVTGFESSGQGVRLPVCAAESGKYELTLRYASPYGTKWNSLYLNDQKLARLDFSQSPGFATKKIPVTLRRGLNQVTVKMDEDDWGWVELDAIWLQRR